MRVYKILPAGFASNTYIITADRETAVVIDPAEETIAEKLRSYGLNCEYVLLTHGHFDHVGGCAVLERLGAKIYCSEREENLIFSREYLGLFGGVYVPPFGISGTFADNRELSLCGINFRVISTPGHTVGSVCIVAEDTIFTGDTLFRGGVGRSDLPAGNFTELKDSLKKLKCLNKDYKILSGHGDDTALGYEIRNNVYLKGL